MNLLEQFLPTFLEDVVGDRFGRYSKYIIQDRAIPDVRDGLKPVQRRILYAMYESGNHPDKPYRKSAKTVGDVMGNFHPHGDSSIYEGMVRMAQPWKIAHPLLDGHGNWGSMDDDPPAAMRYTEARLSPIAIELLKDLDKNTVRFRENFDNTTSEPVVLPARFPNLLVNGSSGISAGFATEIPTHNLQETIAACILLMDHPDASVVELMSVIKGPDFPTGGIIMGVEGIRQAYESGRGKIYIRGKTAIEDLKGGKQQIIVTEIPYQVVKSKLVNAIDQIRMEKKVEGIAEVRDESGRNGLRIVIELKKDTDAQGVLAYLFKKTSLQIAYNFNMVAIVNKAPQQLGLKAILKAYIAHQKEVVTFRSEFELAKAKDRAHVLEGLVRALEILDEIITIIKKSKNRQNAQINLVEKFNFSERQADAILTLQLYRLTNLEIHQLEKEHKIVTQKIQHLTAILAHPKKLLAVIKAELQTVREQYGQSRRSLIQNKIEEIKVDLQVIVPEEQVYVTMSREGYIKRTTMKSFLRSGGEMSNTGIKENDQVRWNFSLSTLECLLLFTQRGCYYSLPVHQIPEFRWKEAGTAIVNVIPLPKEDRIVNVIPIHSEDLATESQNLSELLFFTKFGQVKRTVLQDYATTRSTAIAACKLVSEDKVIQVLRTNGQTQGDVMLVTKQGMSIRFPITEVNRQGRVTIGVRGILLKEDDEVIQGLYLLGEPSRLLILSNYGYAKQTSTQEYPVQSRGKKGVLTFEFKKGPRVRSHGTHLIAALLIKAKIKEAQQINVYTTTGFSDHFPGDKAPLEGRLGRGKAMLGNHKQNPLAAAFLHPRK